MSRDASIAHDTMLDVLKICRELGVSFWLTGWALLTKLSRRWSL